MNAFWNCFETLLGLGVELKDLTSRAINGSAAFFATLGGGVVLVVIHRLFAFLAFYSHGFGILVKGRPDVIARDGQPI